MRRKPFGNGRGELRSERYPTLSAFIVSKQDDGAYTARPLHTRDKKALSYFTRNALVVLPYPFPIATSSGERYPLAEGDVVDIQIVHHRQTASGTRDVVGYVIKHRPRSASGDDSLEHRV